jgi:hypothetical protein
LTEEHPGENSITEIRAFFGATPGNPLKENEFADFWKSLTDKEKDEFRKADLKKEKP